MDNQLEWQERYNIGVPLLDEEHRKLFGIIDRLLVCSQQKEKHQWVCQEGIKYFKNFAIKHFENEEEYMRSIQYGHYDIHKRIHDDFRNNTIPALERELERENYSEEAVNHFLGVCTGWLVGHTLTEDHAITGRLESKWGSLLQEEESAALSEALTRVLYDVFRLEGQVVSEAYGGEMFGGGVYYRLSYHSEEKGAWEIYLAFDNMILINTVGKIMGYRFDKVNATLINAVRYVTQQMMECIRHYFPTLESCALKEEKLLNYNQFKEQFDRKFPRCSLLFDTSEGYFSFSVAGPLPVEESEAFSIRIDEDGEAIEDYIAQNLASQEAEKNKKKVLVVDDSKVTRTAMARLLEQDYVIEEADSGLAALRCIMLNRPDLILLDYEMPICDGGQVLEMIRSEKDYDHIPVFFLTGRGDAETVKKVRRLKPAGYLLKTLPLEDVKEKIDDYFETEAGSLQQ